jgi:hypothetical protein
MAKPSIEDIPTGGFVLRFVWHANGEQHEGCKATLDPI